VRTPKECPRTDSPRLTARLAIRFFGLTPSCTATDSSASTRAPDGCLLRVCLPASVSSLLVGGLIVSFAGIPAPCRLQPQRSMVSLKVRHASLLFSALVLPFCGAFTAWRSEGLPQALECAACILLEGILLVWAMQSREKESPRTSPKSLLL
jgi:hypothetical protein